MTDEFEIKILETAERLIAHFPPCDNEEPGVGGLVISAAYKSRHLSVEAEGLPQMPDTVELMRALDTGWKMGDTCYDKVTSDAYQRLSDGGWEKMEHPAYPTDLPKNFRAGTLEARTFDMLVHAAKTVIVKH